MLLRTQAEGEIASRRALDQMVALIREESRIVLLLKEVREEPWGEYFMLEGAPRHIDDVRLGKRNGTSKA